MEIVILRMKGNLMQQIIEVDNQYKQIDNYLLEKKIKKIFLVCGGSIKKLTIGKYFNGLDKRIGVKVIKFSNFKPNPLYESVVEGVSFFKSERCDCIIAVGGGSAIDVAKCVKLYSNMDENKNYLDQEIVPNDIEFIAVPTTAGTGAEATKFAVIYYNGEKQSVSHYSCIPGAVVINPRVLETLPEYQKKSTMMDALCHATESFWSVNSTEESQMYSTKAIRLVLENYKGYLNNTPDGNSNMLKAANIAGKAINLTQTTAGHAMCYKLTSLYGIAHGHAAALCVSKLYPYMLKNIDKCVDPRGGKYLAKTFIKLANAYGCNESMAATKIFDGLINELNLEVPKSKEEDCNVLKNSVNLVRLKNNPVSLNIDVIDNLYHQILCRRIDNES